ncbi:hypothetical protein DMB66_22345 [Actinoplanes sp. ATCC 53533]|uniref:hypothetical protein n=1 Tax=Actinoplanes sp. ATCC 53533 TaxID=1288362 RepID=UPI000F777C1F|nr:hypothetical protein [Actinoplanes sp. ATCC 53533]RSM62225.1 hypothetical protein DMB66_22345 [Actinoplanes sp. ATCC 53533]
MSEDEVRLPERPDRLAVLSDRATARRRGRTGSAAMAAVAAVAAVAGVAVVGALLGIPAQERHLENVAAHPNSRTAPPAVPSNGQPVTAHPSGQVATSAFASPAVSQAYVTVSPGPDTPYPTDLPPRDAPLPPSGTCPTSVDPMRLPTHNPWDATTWPERVSAVTLCRYEHSTFDTSEGHNTLTRGPVAGDLAVFAAALDKALPPVRPINHAGCRIANPGPPYTIDIVFVTAARDTGKAYLMLRTLCDPPWPENPERALDEAVDAVLGPPY